MPGFTESFIAFGRIPETPIPVGLVRPVESLLPRLLLLGSGANGKRKTAQDKGKNEPSETCPH
jgi:hypothetical protein